LLKHLLSPGGTKKNENEKKGFNFCEKGEKSKTSKYTQKRKKNPRRRSKKGLDCKESGGPEEIGTALRKWKAYSRRGKKRTLTLLQDESSNGSVPTRRPHSERRKRKIRILVFNNRKTKERECERRFVGLQGPAIPKARGRAGEKNRRLKGRSPNRVRGGKIVRQAGGFRKQRKHKIGGGGEKIIN